MRASRAIVIVLAAIACSGAPATPDGGPDAGRDAGRDAARLDVGPRDGGIDADLAVDSGALDAAPDPEWVRLEGSPDDCYMEYAVHPERVVRVDWLPCPSSIPSCTQAVFEPRLVLRPAGRTAAWDPVAGRGFFTGRNGTAAGGTSTIALISTEGAAVVAVHAMQPARVACAGQIAGGIEGASVLSDYVPGPVAGPRPTQLRRGPFDSWFETPLPLGELATLPTLASVQYFMTSASVTVSQIVPRGYLLISRDGEPSNHTRAGGATPYAVVGDDVFWASDGEIGRTTRIFHTGPTDADDLLIDGAATDEAFESFTTDGTTMIWTPMIIAPDGETVTGFRLMTSPYATTAADVVARLVPGELPDTAGLPRLGPGVVAYIWYDGATTEHRIDVVQLADGSHTRVALPVGPSPLRWWIDDAVAWVTDDEVAVPAHEAGGDPTMLRIARSAFVPVP